MGRNGKSWKDGLKALRDAYPEALSLQDNTTRLFPFMLAAASDVMTSNDNSIDTIYRLLKANPELVRIQARNEAIKQYRCKINKLNI